MRILLLLALAYYYVSANAHIFVYHRFGDDKHASTNTTLQQLREHFEYFKNNQYKVVKIEKIIDKLNNNETIPDNWVALTIDDSFKSFYTNGLPLFKEYNYPFSLYVYVEATQNGYGDFMNWEELKETAKYGSIELHSYGHKHMTHLSDDAIFNDTKKSYELFEKYMGYKPSIYVYPFGEYDKRVKTIIEKFNFKAILNQNNGSVNAHSDVLDINRIALVGEVNIRQKIRYNTLEVQWIEPQVFPNDNLLKSVKARVNPIIKKVKLFVSGHGWREINVNNGIIDAKLNLELKNNRTRVIIGTDYYTISNKLIIKNK